MSPFEAGRRLCLLFRSGGVRYAVEATAVTEVATLSGSVDHLRGTLELKDLSLLLGGPPEPEARMAVVLDTSPTLAVRIAQVEEVVDVAHDARFGVPGLLGDALGFICRGAILHGGALYLELDPDALPHKPGRSFHPAQPAVYLCPSPPDRALVFESQGRRWGIALSQVSAVVSADGAFCAIPGSEGAVVGLFHHQQALWPALCAPALLGGPAVKEGLLVLCEPAGQNVALFATGVVGVVDRFAPSDHPGEFVVPGLSSPVLFPDFERMFS